MYILMWIVFGLVVGVIAKLLTPGREPGGFILTTLLGIGGAVVGGFLGRVIGLYPTYQSTGGFFMSILGAVVILAIYNAVTSRRSRTLR
ncbi:GlsB/YeaQ/YmgE family stress response membrane protein [Chondromyces crocatus]|uniref:Transglycosylase n=1 Tax=Chondromyces crocatus TaxID=52 RepID=A0A0K1EK42_CHOCO|nr:GlsB/YeaQ/YmgE family stress response membrane protein [Chondromyces crocatus]AKT40968.1 transglycosylase [Chondromyces crocatus]